MTSRSEAETNRRDAVCAWKYCPRASQKLHPGEGVKEGNRWMHKSCAKKASGITAIRDFYYENVDRNVVVKQLVSVINNIIITKSVDPSFVLFAIKYAIKNNIPIRAPYSLHYLVTNSRVKDAWERYNRRNRLAKMIKEQKAEMMQIIPPETPEEKYDSPKTGFGSIFGK